MSIGKVRVLGALAALVVALTVVGSALAAHPKAGKKYAGFTSERRVNGFGAPVTFKVSSSGTALRAFTYSSLGCFGSGGLPPGTNPFKIKFNIEKLGTVAVTSTGAFSAKNVKMGYTVAGQHNVTTSTVAGKFKNADTAVGTIKLSQTVHGGGVNSHCTAKAITFSAKRVKSKSK